MVAESDGTNAFGAYGEGDETFLRRAGTLAQRRHTRKATQLAAAAASFVPMPDTPTSIPSSSVLDFPMGMASSDRSSTDLGHHHNQQSPASSPTAEEHSLTSPTSLTFDMDNFNVPDLPQPHIPLRKSSASNLRDTASPRVEQDEYHALPAESPLQSHFPARVSSRTNSPRMLKDQQAPMPTSTSPETASPIETTSPTFAQPPRGRARGMTVTTAHRARGDFGLQYRSPSIPDLRGNARAHMSSTYKPERGPTSRDHSMAYKSPPPMPWKDGGDEVRSSIRSALTNASYATHVSSGYYEPSETERSSVITRSSSVSNYSRNRATSIPDEDDDFDACDYIDMYAVGFEDEEEENEEHEEHEEQEKEQLSARTSIVDPAVQAPLSSSPEPEDTQADVSPISSHRTASPELLRIVPTKYDSKFDDELPLPKSPPLPNSPPLSRSTPNSPALLSHPVNPSVPPSPASPLRFEDRIALQPVSPLTPVDVSFMDTTGFEPSPLESLASGYFPPIKPSIPKSTPRMAPMSIPAEGSVSSVPRDRYGFKKATQYVTVEQYDAWNAQYSNYLERRKMKWEIMMIQWGLPISEPVRFPPRSDKVKRYIRKGIPPEWRGACWFWYAGGPTRLAQNPGVYDRLVREAETGQLSDIDRESIERDLNRTFPDNIEFKLDTPVDADSSSSNSEDEAELPIIQSLRRVLQAFAIHNPSIGYCQSLNFLAGMLLLFLRDEEKSFHLLNVITNVHLPGTHAKVLEANVDVGVLMTCIRDSMPQVWAKIDDVTDGASRGAISTTRLPTVSLATTAWFMSCFVGNLPIESVLRVWDCFFYEGSKTLFRIALAIFKTGESEIRNVSEHLEIFQVVQAIPRRLLDVNALLESCYKRRNGFGHLSQDVIDGRRRERRSALRKDREWKNGGQLSPRVVEDVARPVSRGRKGTTLGSLSRAASRGARNLSRARSRKREITPVEPMPPALPSILGGQF